MNDLMKVFSYESSEIRTVVQDGKPWFVAKDVCEILGITNVSKAVMTLNNKFKTTLTLSYSGTNYKTNAIAVNEAGLYKLIFKSRKEEAEKFSDWIAEEVLPSIRETGSYSVQLPHSFSEALMLAANLQKKIEEDQPKIEAHDRFISASNNQKMAEVAKVLGLGRNTLFAKLRSMKILMPNNTPYQRYIDQGYFVVKETSVVIGDETINKPQTYVTAKGVDWLSKKIGQTKKPLLAQ
ncbi:phage antirepressor KilAC domain-containing protein [Shouchella lehensis]|uniref:Bro-N domain-containing protein n=1 Tax=Shouchella lehensis TaxID=300825 RepID=A0A4Y7WI07_9BACI|nr:phage antirepressor KilAC domain-containing protein [Shouchella lehensis]TES48053.1 hypothetical protein E2L03_13035 [Shouchella lehensis]